MDLLRKTHLQTIWSSFALIWLGFWLLFTYPLFGLIGPLAWSDFLSGLLLIIFGIASLSYKKLWAPWALVFLGVWLQFAPLIFWTQTPAAYLNDTLIGALVIALSILIPEMPNRLPDLGPSIPPGWNYNPSSWPQRIPIVILGTIGWFISRYLAAYQLGFIDQIWDPVFHKGTIEVLTSTVSRSLPISDAGLGAIVYTLEALLALKGGERRWRTMPWMVILFGLLVVPLGLVSITLIILQPLIVGAWCFLCLCTALCMTIMVAFAVDEVAAVIQLLHRHLHQNFWTLFWKGAPSGNASEEINPIALDAGWIPLFKAASLGISIPWNLFISFLLGALLMLFPWIWKIHADGDFVLGAFAIVISIISMAEVIRKAHLINLILGLALLCSLFALYKELPPLALISHICMGIFLIFLNLRSKHLLKNL